MFAGKTSSLQAECMRLRERYGSDAVKLIKRKGDARYAADDYLATHDGILMPAQAVEKLDDINITGTKAVVIDELHFF